MGLTRADTDVVVGRAHELAGRVAGARAAEFATAFGPMIVAGWGARVALNQVKLAATHAGVALERLTLTGGGGSTVLGPDGRADYRVDGQDQSRGGARLRPLSFCKKRCSRPFCPRPNRA